MTAHARLSASAAHRWMACPGSVKLSDGQPNTTSKDAAYGTFAHFIAADCLNGKPLRLWKNVGMDFDGFSFIGDQETLEGVQFYLDVCQDDFNKGDTQWVEVNTTPALSKLHPDLGGTADFVRYRPSTKHLRVTDLKFGAGVLVDVEDNKQLLTYALGAMLSLPAGTPVHEVQVTIVQPRAEHPEGRERNWTFPAVEIMDFAADLIEAAKATEAPNAPLVAGKKQCQWCLAARICPELEKRQHALIAADFGRELAAYDPVKLAAALDSIPLVETRIKALREFAYAEAEIGKTIPGYKLVQKVAHRSWKSEGDVIEWAQKNAIECYAPRELLSPAQIEITLKAAAPRGKKKDAGIVLAPFTQKISSGLTLAPASDSRPAAKRISASDFAVIEGNAKALL